jgi:HK97 family phage major capsid protein
MKTDQLIEERKGLLAALGALAAKADEEDRGFSAEEQSEATEKLGRVKAITSDLARANKSQKLSADIQEFISEAEAHELNSDLGTDHRSYYGEKRLKSLGELFVESDQFKAAMAPFGGVGKAIPGKSRFASDPVVVPGGLKALVSTPGSGSDGVNNLYDPQRLPTVPATWPELKLRQIITNGTTTSDSIKYARILREGIAGGSVNNATGVPEAKTAAAIGSGNPAVTPAQAGLKPESALRFGIEDAAVVTIAHWIPATRKALSDVGQLRTLIDAFLSTGLDQELERVILGGDSDNEEEFDGLLNTTGLQDQAFDTNILVTIRKAITKVRRYGRPNAVLVSSEDAERIDLLRTATGNYLGGGAFGAAASTVWRTPLIEVPSLAAGTVLLGDFSTAVLWDREETTITATDSHADFFVRNLIAILAEMRAAFGVLDPALLAVAHVNGEDEIVPPAAAAA